MELPHIIVAYRAGKARTDQLSALFRDSAVLTFLEHVKPGERASVLAGADVLLSWNPARELKPKEFPLLRKLHLLQLLSAGADHVPFRELPRNVVIASNVGAYSEPIAEHVLAMALALAKNLFREHLKLARGEFNQANLNTMLHGAVAAFSVSAESARQLPVSCAASVCGSMR
jgi:glycerate dehydrogenase